MKMSHRKLPKSVPYKEKGVGVETRKRNVLTRSERICGRHTHKLIKTITFKNKPETGRE